ncbi:MAG: SinR family protein [Candidatus Limnocylindrales bacterium]
MNVFLIAYDLIKPGEDYPDLITTIKGISGSWCHLEESVWLTKTDSTVTSTSIRDTIQSASDSNDKIFVAEVTGDSMAWRNLGDEISDWIKSNFNG